MIDSFPYDEWGDSITKFWTFSGGTTGTYVLTVLGIVLMVVAIIGWVLLENRKLTEQTARLRAAGPITFAGTGPGTVGSGVGPTTTPPTT
jgi:hypothetical protein